MQEVFLENTVSGVYTRNSKAYNKVWKTRYNRIRVLFPENQACESLDHEAASKMILPVYSADLPALSLEDCARLLRLALASVGYAFVDIV